MKIVEVRHPLIQHKLGLMRRAGISTKEFRELASEVAALLTYAGDAATGIDPKSPFWTNEYWDEAAK